MPGRYSSGILSRGLGYRFRHCRNDHARGNCLGYGMGYRFDMIKEFLQKQKEYLKQLIEEIDTELDNLN